MLFSLNLPAVGRKDLAAFDDVEVHSPDDFTFAVGDIFSQSPVTRHFLP